MKEQQFEVEGQAYQLPPVELPRIPAPPPKKSLQELVTAVPNLFSEKKIKIEESSVQSLEFLNDGLLLAVGHSSGTINIVSVPQENLQFKLKGQDHSPVTGLASNPNSTHLKHALMATHSNGTLQYWHATSGQLLFSRKYQEMLQTCEISPLGTHYAFSGEHGKIRFGLLNKGEPSEVESGHLGKHDNRVYCLKWNPQDNNMVASGGWDKSVYFWDLRVKTSIKQVYGYYMGGEAIDFNKHEVLLGDNKPDHPLKIYDMKADKLRQIQWIPTSEKQTHYSTGVLSCFYINSKTQDIIACTPKNQVRLFKQLSLVSQFQAQDKDEEEPLRLHCMQYFKDANKVVTGWNDGTLNWLSF